MSARASIRAATAPDHERVDGVFTRFLIGEAEGYRRFLQAQAAALLPVEEALDRSGAAELLDDWAERRRGHLVARDLASVGAEIPAHEDHPDFECDSTMLGAIYVLEGSRLGGRLLQRELSADAPRQFLSTNQSSAKWRKLIEFLDLRLSSDHELERAIGAARQVFDRFAQAGQYYSGDTRG